MSRAIRNEGLLYVMSCEPNEPMTGALDLPRLPAWMGRFFGALLADVKSVDAGSLDVLVYCRDDLAVAAPADWPVTGSVDGS